MNSGSAWTVMVDLGVLAPLSGWERNAAGVNDNGQIVVNANDTATSQTRTLLLTPS